MNKSKKEIKKVDSIEEHFLIEEILRESFVPVSTVIQQSTQAIIVLDKKLMIIAANELFYSLFVETKDDVEHKNIFDISNKSWDIEELRESLEDILINGTFFKALHVNKEFGKLGKKALMISARYLYPKNNGMKDPKNILLVIDDITDIMEAAQFIVKEATTTTNTK